VSASELVRQIAFAGAINAHHVARADGLTAEIRRAESAEREAVALGLVIRDLQETYSIPNGLIQDLKKLHQYRGGQNV
jgi:hypothetical protein